MTFLISFPKVLSNMIGWKDLGKLYDGLLGLGIITIDNNLKWFGQVNACISDFDDSSDIDFVTQDGFEMSLW